MAKTEARHAILKFLCTTLHFEALFIVGTLTLQVQAAFTRVFEGSSLKPSEAVVVSVKDLE
jgi:hypothetical protein